MLRFLFYFGVSFLILWTINFIALGICYLIRRGIIAGGDEAALARIDKAIWFFKWTIVIAILIKKLFKKNE